MKKCITCGRPADRGATSPTARITHCLVCRVAASMKTFVYVPTYAPARRKPRGSTR